MQSQDKLWIFSALSICLLVASSYGEAKQPIRRATLLGTWQCGPTLMNGPNFDIEITEKTTNFKNGKFTTRTTSRISPKGQAPFETNTVSHGTWNLDGDIVISHFVKSKFLGSTNPQISNEIGQRSEDTQLQKKSTYKSRIIKLDHNIFRSIPVDSMYKEAEVESTCKRI